MNEKDKELERKIHRMAVHTAVGGHEMNIGDKVTAKWEKGKQFEIVEKLAMASSDFPDGWAYLLKDDDGNETWTSSTCVAIGITSPIQLRLF